MKFISLLLLFSSLYATEYAPWFPPFLEFQAKGSYLYEHAEKVESPLGSFRAPTNNSSLRLSLDVTPWPYWNAEAELFLTQTQEISFGYEAALFTLRYAWFDDIAGDLISLVTGATLSFPQKRFLHELSYAYHGTLNSEFHATIGKEWSHCCDWLFRAWALAGFGTANRGSPWLHGVATIEGHLNACFSAGLFLEALYGLGKHNIVPHIPFEGYAHINHQNIDLGIFLNYTLRYFGTLTLLGWHNLHAHNFIEHYWGLKLSLLVPFSLL